MKGEIKSNEVRVRGDKLYSDNQRIGYVFGNDDDQSDGIYIVLGTEIYQDGKRMGYDCQDGTVRINDGTFWKYP